MSGGDLLFIFSFLILPTILLVSCIWLYILLRKGVLLPPARQMPLVTDEDAVVDDEMVLDAHVSQPAAPVIAMHVAHADDDDEDAATHDIDSTGVTQETVEFQTLSAALAGDVEDTTGTEAALVVAALEAESDDGTEAMPVPPDEVDISEAEAGDVVAGGAIEPMTATAYDAASPSSIASPATDLDAASAVAESSTEVADAIVPELAADDVEPTTQPTSIADFDDEVFAPLDDKPRDIQQAEQPSVEPAGVEHDDTTSPEDDAEGGYPLDQFDITDEHPIVAVAPAAMHPNGIADRDHPEAESEIASANPSDRSSVAQPHSNPRALPTGRRRQIRRPETGG